jgi:ribosomal protein S18 acetylase RimI-like enzyme
MVKKKHGKPIKCHYCRRDAVFKCGSCGRLLCGKHAQLRTTCPECTKKTKLKHTIGRATSHEERKDIEEFVRAFWGEEEQLTFDRKFMVTQLPAFIARFKDRLIGFISTADLDDAVIIVAIGILPEFQSLGVGKGLVKKVEDEAVQRKKKRLLVSTSNDDLPALAFYQSLGFQIYEVKPNVIAEKHGKILMGIGNLPIRDELRLEKRLG